MHRTRLEPTERVRKSVYAFTMNIRHAARPISVRVLVLNDPAVGLSAASLRSAMTSLSSSLTTLRTSAGRAWWILPATSSIPGTHYELRFLSETASYELVSDIHRPLSIGGGNGMTFRTLAAPEHRRAAFERAGEAGGGSVINFNGSITRTAAAEAPTVIRTEDGWDVYGVDEIVSKTTYNRRKKAFVTLGLSSGANGVAMRSSRFAQGVERAAFWCNAGAYTHSLFSST